MVDDEGLLDLLNVCQRSTYKNVNVSPDLAPEPVNDVRSLLKDFQDVFTEQPGCTPLVEHKLDVTASQSIRVKPNPMPYAKRKEVDEEIQNNAGSRSHRTILFQL